MQPSEVILDAEDLSDLVGSELETFSIQIDGDDQKVKLRIVPRKGITKEFAERALAAMLGRRMPFRIVSKSEPKPGYTLEYPLFESRLKVTSYKVMDRKRIVRVTLDNSSGKRKRGP